MLRTNFAACRVAGRGRPGGERDGRRGGGHCVKELTGVLVRNVAVVALPSTYVWMRRCLLLYCIELRGRLGGTQGKTVDVVGDQAETKPKKKVTMLLMQ